MSFHVVLNSPLKLDMVLSLTNVTDEKNILQYDELFDANRLLVHEKVMEKINNSASPYYIRNAIKRNSLQNSINTEISTMLYRVCDDYKLHEISLDTLPTTLPNTIKTEITNRIPSVDLSTMSYEQRDVLKNAYKKTYKVSLSKRGIYVHEDDVIIRLKKGSIVVNINILNQTSDEAVVKVKNVMNTSVIQEEIKANVVTNINEEISTLQNNGTMDEATLTNMQSYFEENVVSNVAIQSSSVVTYNENNSVVSIEVKEYRIPIVGKGIKNIPHLSSSMRMRERSRAVLKSMRGEKQYSMFVKPEVARNDTRASLAGVRNAGYIVPPKRKTRMHSA
jgi:hypothetical protein